MSARGDDERVLRAWARQLHVEGFGAGLAFALLLLIALEVLA